MTKISPILVLSVALLVSACAQTPDLGPWSSQTASLKSAISSEHSDISAKFAETTGVANKIGDVSTDTHLSNEALRFGQAASKVEGTFAVLTVYSSAIVELAKAGETGSESIDKIASTIEEAAVAVDVAIPAVSQTGRMVFNFVKILADAYTRSQAQESLGEAMAAAQPAIESISNELISSYQTNGSVYKITIALSETEQNLIAAVTEPDLPGTYLLAVDSFDTDTAARLKPAFDSYIEAWTASEQWARARLEKSQAIIAAVNAWKSEHARVAAFLKKCAGLQFKPFEQGCDNMDFSHLLGLIKTLKGE